MKITVNKHKLEITPEMLKETMKVMVKEKEPLPIKKYYVSYRNRKLPIKRLFARCTNLKLDEFTSVYLLQLFRRLGLVVHTI